MQTLYSNQVEYCSFSTDVTWMKVLYNCSAFTCIEKEVADEIAVRGYLHILDSFG